MSISFSLEALIDLIGLIIGLSFGFGVIIYRWDKKTFLYLGLFILVYSYGFAASIIETTLKESAFKSILLSIRLSWLLFPLFYIYVQYISTLKVKEVKKPLIIGVVGILLEFVLKQFVTPEFKYYAYFYFLLVTFETVLAIYYGYKTIRWTNKQKREVYNHFSNVIDKELNWSKIYIILGLFITILGYVIFIFGINISLFFYYLVQTINILLLVWLSFKSVFQKQVEKIEDIKDKQNIIDDTKRKIDAGTKCNEIVLKLDDIIKKSKCYAHPELTIAELSNLSNIHTKKISYSINSALNTNFNSYINSFRIDDAKERLKNTDFSKYSIEGVGQEVGFKSKSTFYRAFKKETGLTPMEFISKN